MEEKRKESLSKKFKNLVANVMYFFIVLFHKFPKVATIDETLDEIINNNKSIARFGDGEIRLINNENISFQQPNEELSKRLREILNSDDENILIGLPDVFSFKDINKSIRQRKLFYKKEIVLKYDSYKVIKNDKKYYNANISRPYLEYKDKSNTESIFNKLKTIWTNKDIIIVEGEGSRLGIGNDLFDNVKSISRILCPVRDAFDKYNDILNKCKEFSKDKLFIIALGPTATVLAYDLAKEGFQALDMGHVDIEYEWFKMGVTEKVKVDGKFTNEVKGGQVVEEIQDDNYERQIIARVL